MKLLAPFAPFITEEIWRNIFGEEKSIHLSQWPKVSEAIAEETLTIPVQVNGKVRDLLSVRSYEIGDKSNVEKKALEREKVKKYIEGKKYKTIYVKGKILNFVLI